MAERRRADILDGDAEAVAQRFGVRIVRQLERVEARRRLRQAVCVPALVHADTRRDRVDASRRRARDTPSRTPGRARAAPARTT